MGWCDCGATDCPSCGPAQGYEVRRVWSARWNRWVYVNPEDEAEAQAEEDEWNDDLTED